MSDRERKRKVSVLGKLHEVNVHRQSERVWIAVGDYMGQKITVHDQSDGAAVKSWSEAARHKSDSEGERTAGAATR
jgi:hypothetical protein